ncbi:glycoside hydrolase family 88 protein [Sphingobacterium spiritivorum]|nr:glycoside hydrolase family 88 protein [Sphingobacterium spiritivorum]
MMKRLFFYIQAILVLHVPSAFAQKATSEQMALTVIDKMFKDETFVNEKKGPKWTYDLGVTLEGMTEVWRNTGDGVYFNYIQSWMDQYVDNEGNIKNYKLADHNIDNVKNGRTLLMLYKVTRKDKYLKAASILFDQLKEHPRTKQGGFWHKKIYPYQMWLDGLYMGQPFYTEYAVLMNKPEVFNDVADQFRFMEQNARDPKTGLLYHGWDESRQEKWSDPQTGLSPHVWARGMGWYTMALVDVLDNFPADHPRRPELLAILNRTAKAIIDFQDKKSGVWYDVLNVNRKENYFESSASSMFVYGLAKSVRKGYISESYLPAVRKGYQGLLKEFVTTAGPDRVDLNKTVAVSGLGGSKNYRDGSFEYYMSEPVISNDPKGVGPFMLAALELEWINAPKKGKGKVVTLDNYYNNEYKIEPSGLKEPYHYLWNGEDNNGFSFMGRIFNRTGANINTLRTAPDAQQLKGSNIYIIVDPDTEKETENPHFMNDKEASAIEKWVKSGGVLVLLLNDSGNCEIAKFNTLSKKFGITFNEDSRNRVQGKNFEQGAILIPESNPIFKTTSKIYIKEISTLQITKPAVANLTDQGDIIIATAKYGKGTVFAVGDPWFYNEYIDGRKLPAEYQNWNATNDLVNWLISQSK